MLKENGEVFIFILTSHWQSFHFYHDINKSSNWKKITFSWSRNGITTVSTGLNSSNCLDTLRPASTLKVLRYSWPLPIIGKKKCQNLPMIGKNCQILSNILSSVVKSCETLSNEKNGDLLSIIPCDFNDGRVSHVDQEVGEGYLTTDESRGWKVQIQIQTTNKYKYNNAVLKLTSSLATAPMPTASIRGLAMKYEYEFCILRCPN